ncbi:hypothetical protein DPEC_G00169840 [Dallia pectoralis]|uniref:Uncharacterized protein n=1 Tax=Dallia pectoralis TaxID=75939 RepID=A0ACC2GCT0_DALPE|nr:hypothetical protein DPEC_G00169840 [Dallia pectoralis]
MEKVLVTMVTVLLVLCPAESQVLSVSGVVGGRVLIKCKHAFASDNNKYFCRGSCTSSDIIIQTTDNKKYNEKGRYSIHAFGNGDVTVIINDLQKSDSGTYWCGVDRVGVDTYQQVYLSVEEGFTTTTDTTSTILIHTVTYSVPDEGISTDVLVYMGAGLVVLVCVLAFLLIYLKQRNRSKIRTACERSKRTSSNPIYSTSTNQQPDTHDISSDHATATNQHLDDVYSNIDPSTEAPDSLSYATFNFPRDPSCLQYANVSFSKESDVRNQPDSVEYSTVRGQRHANHEMETYSTVKPTSSR